MQQPTITPVPAQPSDRLRKNEPDSGPDERPEYTAQDLVKNYGLSRQEAQRLIDRFGPFAAGLDFILAGKGRPRRHRRQDMERSAEEIAFGRG